MRTSKYVGFLAMVLGGLLIASAAALPVTVDRRDTRSIGVGFRDDGCGPALYAAVRHSESECQSTAKRRLMVTTTLGLMIIVVGLVMFAGGDSRGSRIDVPTPRLRRHLARSPGSRRSTPG